MHFRIVLDVAVDALPVPYRATFDGVSEPVGKDVDGFGMGLAIYSKQI